MIIGISGFKGSGKDTLADWLVKEYGFVKIGLADPLKRFCAEAFDFSDEALWGPSELREIPDERYPTGKTDEETGKSIYLTPRRALQQLGTEWGRNCYENVWIDKAIRDARRVTDIGMGYHQTIGLRSVGRLQRRSVVIPDVRFINEMRALKKAGAAVVRVKRGEPTVESHQSESEQLLINDSEFDHVFENDGTINDLRAMVTMWCQKNSIEAPKQEPFFTRDRI